MHSVTAIRQRPTIVRHVSVRVELPEGATPGEQDALIAQALSREAARRGGAAVFAGHGARQFGPIRLRGIVPAGRNPKLCTTPRQFLDTMLGLKERLELSYVGLERRARELGYSPLPHSTIARLLADENQRTMPSQQRMTSFVLTCGVSETKWREWAIAWEDVQPFLDRPKPWVLQGGKDGADRVVSIRPQRTAAEILFRKDE